MSKQLSEIIVSFSSMTEEEQLKIVQRIRHNKYVAKPALAVRKKKASAPKKKKQNKQIHDLLKGLTPAQIAKLMESM